MWLSCWKWNTQMSHLTKTYCKHSLGVWLPVNNWGVIKGEPLETKKSETRQRFSTAAWRAIYKSTYYLLTYYKNIPSIHLRLVLNTSPWVRHFSFFLLMVSACCIGAYVSRQVTGATSSPLNNHVRNIRYKRIEREKNQMKTGRVMFLGRRLA